MIRSMMFAAAAAVLPAAAVAAPAPAPEVPAAVSDAAPVSAGTAPRRYCVVDTLTGTRLAKRECKTLDAWLAEGVDPRAK